MPYFVQLPLIGPVPIQVISGVTLYVVMILGMVAKAIWDRTDVGRVWPKLTDLVRPFVVSPIVFSAFLGLLFLERRDLPLSVTTALFAFQIGFMWQHVLQSRTSATEKAVSLQGRALSSRVRRRR